VRTSLETVGKARMSVAGERRQLGNPGEGKRPSLEAVTRELAKTVTKDTTVYVTVIRKV
jgi:hypothetical protein